MATPQIILTSPSPFGKTINQVAIAAGSGLILVYQIKTVQRIGIVRLAVNNIGANNLTGFALYTATCSGDPTLPTISTSSFASPESPLLYSINTSGFTGSGITPGQSFAVALLAGGMGQIDVYMGSTSGTTTDISVNFEPYAAV